MYRSASEDALDRDHEIVAKGLHRGLEGFRAAFDIARQAHRAGGIQDTRVHHTGVKLDAAVVLVLTGIEFHLRASPTLEASGTRISA
jgi:hypothetical protein